MTDRAAVEAYDRERKEQFADWASYHGHKGMFKLRDYETAFRSKKRPRRKERERWKSWRAWQWASGIRGIR